MALIVSSSLVTCIFPLLSDERCDQGCGAATSMTAAVRSDLAVSNQHQDVVGFLSPDNFHGFINDWRKIRRSGELNSCDES